MTKKIKKNLSPIKTEALNNNVPIICDDGLLFLVNTLKENNAKLVLEIGSAVGYSAIHMALETNCKVITLERDYAMYEKALENIKSLGLMRQIDVICGDALEIILNKNIQFDAIFIDAAKAQYEKFFNRFEPYLKKDGVIITDNLNFHHVDLETVSKGTRNLVKRLEAFKVFLEENPHFISEIYEIGDGMSISRRVI